MLYIHSYIKTHTHIYAYIIIRVFASFLLEETLSAYCPATLTFGNMAPFWTYSLFKVILPTSFWMTLGHLWSCGHHSCTCLVHLLSFSCETCPGHWCLLVQIWWITSMMPVFKWIQLALFLLFSVSPIIIHSILHCVVTIFYSCILLRYHVLLPYMITGSMHSLCTFIFNLSGMLLFHVMESSLPKAVQPRPILCLISSS